MAWGGAIATLVPHDRHHDRTPNFECRTPNVE